LAIDEADGTASLDLAFEVAAHFGIKADKARGIVGEAGAATARWRNVAKGLGLSANEIERMASAFEQGELKKATSG
jgi:serine/threonine-protein kinase HipA